MGDGLLSKLGACVLAAFGSRRLFFTKFVDMALYFTLWYATLFFFLVLLLLVLQKLIVFEQILYARRGPP